MWLLRTFEYYEFILVRDSKSVKKLQFWKKNYFTHTNHSILNDRKQYHYENEVSYIDLNKANHIRLVRTFFDELKWLYCHKTISSNIYFCKSMSKKSMARSSALPATIDYIIEISIELHLHITTIKPVEKGSNQLQSIL